MTDTPQTDKPNIFFRFFSLLWSIVSWLRSTVMNIIFLVIVVAIVLSIQQQTPTALPETFNLNLDISGAIVEERSLVNPTQALLNGGANTETETVLSDIVKTLQFASTDNRIQAVILQLNNLTSAGIAQLEEISAALMIFKGSGKKIIAVANGYNQNQYYLASHADKVYLHDMGTVSITGFGSYRIYFKDALEKLGINVNIFRAGEYKDAIEPFTRNDMSDTSRAQNELWVNDLWHSYSTKIEALRNLPSGSINNLINNIDTELAKNSGNSALLALNAGLVDIVASQQNINQSILDEFNIDLSGDNSDNIYFKQYLATKEIPQPFNTETVGVITATGNIMPGDQPEGMIGDESFSRLLQQVRHNKNIKALVIRIDSGGGSATASEIIRSDIESLRAAGIPVIISMGNVAASGGYWIATAADEIWAMPSTITGSIGVFSILPTFQKSLAKLGVHSDGLGSTELADAWYLNHELNPKISSMAQLNVNAIYKRFLSIVSEARDLSLEQVEAIASGRVWSGAKALELNLVDNLGSREEAIIAAAELAELESWSVTNITRELTPSEAFIENLMSNQVSQSFLSSIHYNDSLIRHPLIETFNSHTSQLLDLKNLKDPNHTFVHCINCTLNSK